MIKSPTYREHIVSGCAPKHRKLSAHQPGVLVRNASSPCRHRRSGAINKAHSSVVHEPLSGCNMGRFESSCSKISIIARSRRSIFGGCPNSPSAVRRVISSRARAIALSLTACVGEGCDIAPRRRRVLKDTRFLPPSENRRR